MAQLAVSAPRRRAETTVPVPALAQACFTLAGCIALVALAAGAGLATARLQEVNRPPQPAWRSAMPLSSASLLAQLRPPPPPALETTSIVSDPPSSAPLAAPTTPEARGRPGATPALPVAAGQRLRIVNVDAGGCVNMRESPSLTGSVLSCLPEATSLTAAAQAPVQEDGYRWWRVDAGGWVAEPYLAAPSGAGNSAVPAPASSPGPSQSSLTAAASAAPLRGFSGWATYYGIEDGFRLGDIMFDGTPYNPGDPTMTAASFLIPIHTWLLVCSAARCIVVQVRDRGLLDENDVLLDLSRAAYAQLFGSLGGKQHVTALLIDPALVALAPLLGASAPGVSGPTPATSR